MPETPQLHQTVTRASAPVTRLPRWVPGAVAAILLVAAAIVGGTSGWILLAAASLVLAWLLFVSWPYLGRNGRLLQLAVVAAAYAVVIVRLVPRG